MGVIFFNFGQAVFYIIRACHFWEFVEKSQVDPEMFYLGLLAYNTPQESSVSSRLKTFSN
jgi:hypothetical protein